MNDNCPCYHCDRPEKCPECHTFCHEFKEWEADHNAKREEDYQRRYTASNLYGEQATRVYKYTHNLRDAYKKK